MKEYEKIQAEKLISEYNLIIKDEEYSLEAISIHSQTDFFYEHDRPQQNYSWHISHKDLSLDKFIPYIDIHFVDKSHFSYRLRINAIKRISDQTTINGPEDIWVLADKEIGSYEFRKCDYKDIGKKTSPQIYLTEKNHQTQIPRTYWVPRLLSDPKKHMSLEEIKSRIKPEMITTNFEWLMNFDYVQKKIISIYYFRNYFSKNKDEIYPKGYLTNRDTLEKHLKLYQSAKGFNIYEIHQSYCNSNRKKHLDALIKTMSVTRNDYI